MRRSKSGFELSPVNKMGAEKLLLNDLKALARSSIRHFG